MLTSTVERYDQSYGWCLDSGASVHLCNGIHSFNEISNSDRGVLNLANHRISKITGKGTVKLTEKYLVTTRSIFIENVSHAPDLRTCLMSVAKITDRDYELVFRKDGATIAGPNGNAVLHADRV